MLQHDHDFLMEKRLRALNPDLHRSLTNTLFAIQHSCPDFMGFDMRSGEQSAEFVVLCLPSA